MKITPSGISLLRSAYDTAAAAGQSRINCQERVFVDLRVATARYKAAILRLQLGVGNAEAVLQTGRHLAAVRTRVRFRPCAGSEDHDAR